MPPKKPAASGKIRKSGRDKKPRVRKAFGLPRDSIYIVDPIADLRICGASGVVPDDESGPLDTAPGPDVPVKDQRRLSSPLRPGFRENIFVHSVRTPIIIAKIGDHATVVEGKSRVRAARAANRRRSQLGIPQMRIRCVMQRITTEKALLEVMISGNNARQDDSLVDRIEKLKSYLDTGASEQDAATAFSVEIATIRGWLDFDDQATEETKAAVRSGEFPASTGAEIAKISDPDDQREALARLRAQSAVRDRSARAARALRRGAQGTLTATDRKSQRMLLDRVTAMAPSRRPDASDGESWFWIGVRDALRLATGGDEVDRRLIAQLSEARRMAPPVTPVPDPESTGVEFADGREVSK